MLEPKLQLSGSEIFSAPPERVFDQLTDLDELAQNIPDLETAQRINENTLACVVRPGFSFMRGKLNLTIQMLEQTRPQAAKLATQMSGIGQSMKAESAIALHPAPEGCGLDWKVDVLELKGLIATVSPSLVKAAAQRIVTDSFARLKKKLAESS